jgi:NAD(P) transhydrogenase subunit alpha
MKISVLRERRSGETRVAATPETVKKLVASGHSVTIESDAGKTAGFLDSAYEEAGASIAKDAAAAVQGADIVFKVRGPEEGEIAALPDGAALIALMEPFAMDPKVIAGLNAKKIAVALHGIHAAYHPGAEHGCALVPVQPLLAIVP